MKTLDNHTGDEAKMTYTVNVSWYRKNKRTPYWTNEDDNPLHLIPVDYDTANEFAFFNRPPNVIPGDRVFVDDGSETFSFRAIKWYGSFGLEPIYNRR